MKKIFYGTVLLCFLSLILISGCENASEESGVRTLTIGTDPHYSPFEYLENGEMKGFDIDLMNEIAELNGYEIMWKQYDFNTELFSKVADGTIDAAIAGITITAERSQSYLFSKPYYHYEDEDDYAIMFNLDSTNLKSLMDNAINSMVNDDIISSLANEYNMNYTDGYIHVTIDNLDQLDGVTIGTTIIQSDAYSTWNDDPSNLIASSLLSPIDSFTVSYVIGDDTDYQFTEGDTVYVGARVDTDGDGQFDEAGVDYWLTLFEVVTVNGNQLVNVTDSDFSYRE